MSAKIAQALHQVMSKVGYVQKTGKNAFHGYKYAGEADLLEKLRPAMLEAGLMLIPSVTDVTQIDEHGITRVRLEYTLIHKDGDVWPVPIGAAGEGGDKNKNGVGDKGLYKALTGANKYLLFKLFQIETGDDPERDSQEPENFTDSHSAYIATVKAVVKASTNADELGQWWNAEDQKTLRRNLQLPAGDVKSLKDIVLARISELKPKVAA